MHIDTLNILAIDIASEVWPLVNHQHALPFLFSLVSRGGSIDARTDNQQIVFLFRSHKGAIFMQK
jgi:hypothetical protein